MKKLLIVALLIALSPTAQAGIEDIYPDGRLGSHGVFMCVPNANGYTVENVPLDLVKDYLIKGAFKQNGDCPAKPTRLPSVGAKGL